MRNEKPTGWATAALVVTPTMLTVPRNPAARITFQRIFISHYLSRLSTPPWVESVGAKTVPLRRVFRFSSVHVTRRQRSDILAIAGLEGRGAASGGGRA